MKTIDFGRSTCVWLLKDLPSYGRFSIDSILRWQGRDGKVDEFLMTGMNMAGNVYVEKDLFKVPPYEYARVFGLRTYSTYRITPCHGDGLGDNFDPHSQLFSELRRNLVEVEGRGLTTSQEVMDATRNNIPYNVHARLHGCPSGDIELIFPIKHMNAHRDTKGWQVETGPVIVPKEVASWRGDIDTLALAFAFVSKESFIEFGVMEPTELRPGLPVTTRFFSRRMVCQAEVRVVAY